MPINAFIIRPFGIKEFVLSTRLAASSAATAEQEPKLDADNKVVEPRRKLIWVPKQDDMEEVIAYEEVEKTEMIKRVRLNFDWVMEKLVDPALDKLRIVGYTTQAFMESGNIREDMFRELLTADLVIADVSIYNPNVYYELGIRHAFRDKYTFMINCSASEQPFDLKTDRYFQYDWRDPGKKETVESLVKALQVTVSSDKGDSPVFKLMPRLEAEDRSRFISVPQEFKEEVERATKYRRGGDLRLLAAEAEGFLWEVEGLRLVGRSQFELNYLPGAKNTWEVILNRYPDDIEANTILSTIYQRTNDAARSEQALSRVSKLNSLSTGRMAEVRGLLGRNLKARWMNSWKNDGDTDELCRYGLTKLVQKEQASLTEAERKARELLSSELADLLNRAEDKLSCSELKTKQEYLQPNLGDLAKLPQEDQAIDEILKHLDGKILERLRTQIWAKRALRSPLLQRAYESYEQAYMADLNYPYAGLNALTLLLVQIDLAERFDKVWESLQLRNSEAKRELQLRKKRFTLLQTAIEVSLEAERQRLRREGRTDFWFEVVEAGYYCVTSDRPEMVAQAYVDALIWVPPYAGNQMRKALQLYKDLDIHELKEKKFPDHVTLRENIDKALLVIKHEASEEPSEKARQILLFMGLRLDPLHNASGRPPSTKTIVGSSSPEKLSDFRFPNKKQIIESAEKAICDVVTAEKKRVEELNGEILCGMSGGASGGDIMFQEICDHLKIPARMFLALPKDQYAGKYVASAGPDWIEKFNRLYRKQRQNGDEFEKNLMGSISALNVLANSDELPRWLQGKKYYNIGRRTNLWMLQNALIASSLTGAEITLIVLWDGKTEGGMGGIGDMIKQAEKNGIRVIRIGPGKWKDSTQVEESLPQSNVGKGDAQGAAS